MTLDAHFRTILAKAQLRQGILSWAARTTWGLETTIPAWSATLLTNDLRRKTTRGRAKPRATGHARLAWRATRDGPRDAYGRRGALRRKATRDALLTNVVGHGLISSGSCIPDDLLNRLDTQAINVAARRLSGLPRITRIEALRSASGTHSSRNHYAHHCALFLHSTLMCAARGVRGHGEESVSR